MIVNDSLKFICDYVTLRTESTRTPFTSSIAEGSVLKIPVAHYQGNYFADAETIRRIEGNGQVVFRYCDAEGRVTADANPNGSVGSIAGICSEQGNVLGMMPHPERCTEPEMGSADGRRLFDSMLSWIKERAR
jgi:phosphoribosylformylglycinamidine synthase